MKRNCAKSSVWRAKAKLRRHTPTHTPTALRTPSFILRKHNKESYSVYMSRHRATCRMFSWLTCIHNYVG